MITGFVHQVQLSVLIKAVGMGYFLGVCFCVMTFLFYCIGKSTAIIFIRDMLFFVYAAFLSFLFLLKYCSGMLRFYVAAGELVGFMIFYIFPGKQLLRFSHKFLAAINLRLQKARQSVVSAVSEKLHKLKDYACKKKEKKQLNSNKNRRKMHIADMPKKLLKHTKKTQKN